LLNRPFFHIHLILFYNCVYIYLQCSEDMDKSWMRKWRRSKEYMDGVKEFMIFSAANSKTKGFIVCPYKKCCLGMTLWEDVVYDHLTSGAGILEGYTEWVMHGEQINPSVNRDPRFEEPTGSPIEKMPTHDKPSGMQAMLRDVFAMHNDPMTSQVGVESEAVLEEDIADYDENTSSTLCSKRTISHSMRIQNIANWGLLYVCTI
jgi:hypothetical protein